MPADLKASAEAMSSARHVLLRRIGNHIFYPTVAKAKRGGDMEMLSPPRDARCLSRAMGQMHNP